MGVFCFRIILETNGFLLKCCIIWILFQDVIIKGYNFTLLDNVNKNCECGKGNGEFDSISRKSRIVEPANKYPWVVALLYKDGFKCGGTLITPNHVVTAAHCLNRPDLADPGYIGNWMCLSLYNKKVSCFLETKDIQTALVKRGSPVPGKKILVRNITIHPLYRPLHERTVNDIAILTLQKSVPCGNCGRPICIAQGPENVYGKVTLAHWGADIRSGEHRLPRMREESLRVWKNVKKCESHNKAQRPNIICATRWNDSAGPCKGDSGSAIFLKRGSQNFIVGLVSIHSSGVCDPTEPTFFTKISPYRRWILKVVRNEIV